MNIRLVKMRYNDEKITDHPSFQRCKVKVTGHYTVHDVFKYDHPMVERFLIEWKSVHTQLIIPNTDECQELIQTKHVARYAYTFKGQMFEQDS